MRKIFSAILALAFVFTFASCSKLDNNTEEENSAPLIEEQYYSQEFTDSNGDVAAKLEISYPKLSGNITEDSQKAIDKYFETYKKDAITSLQDNADNISQYLKNFELTGPEITKITFRTYYADATTVSFVISKVSATNPDDCEPQCEGMTFSVTTGERLTINHLAKGIPEDIEPLVIEQIIETANTTYSENGFAISDDTKEKLEEYYISNNFVYDGESIAFLYNYAILSDDSRSGVYYCSVPLESLEDIVKDPANYY